MKIIEDPRQMQEWSLQTRGRRETIALVPTMGSLHEGHLSLLREGKKRSDKLVLSLFINPTQFGPQEDFGRYPKNFQGDLEKAKRCGVDILFCPTPEEMYPKKFQTFVTVEALEKPLCGKSRPTHFRGVATVVLKLFNIILPHIALFGQKDFQQLQIIRRMAADLNLGVTILGMPILREVDGLAMSSRNLNLSPEEKRAALALSLSLAKAQALLDRGEKNIQTLLQTVAATLEETRKIRIDYIAICDVETLEELEHFKSPALLAMACFVGTTRLIDNAILR